MKDDCTVIEQAVIPEESETVDGITFSSQTLNIEDSTIKKEEPIDEDKLQCIHIQRIPANSKVRL